MNAQTNDAIFVQMVSVHREMGYPVCGETKGEAPGHHYEGGTCTLCGEAEPNYFSLTAGCWKLDSLTEDGGELERFSLHFDAESSDISSMEGSTISVSYYRPFDEMDEEEQDWYISTGYELYEFEGRQYASMMFGDARPMRYREEGNTVVCDVWEDEIIGSFTLERQAGDRFVVTAVSGRIIDELITGALRVGSVFVISPIQ